MDSSSWNALPPDRWEPASRSRWHQPDPTRARPRLLVVAILGLGLALAVSGPAQGRGSPACATKAARTLLATKHARVFKKRQRIYACLYRTRRSFRIGGRNSSGGKSSIGNLRLAGRFVAYSRMGQRGIKLTVRELRKGRIVRDTPATVSERPGLTAVTDVELKRNGSLAWIVKRTPIDGPLSPYPLPADSRSEYHVRKSDRTGHALLDSGHDIAPRSLVLRRATLYWMKSGNTRSATLD